MGVIGPGGGGCTSVGVIGPGGGGCTSWWWLYQLVVPVWGLLDQVVVVVSAGCSYLLQIGQLQAKIVAEDKVVEMKTVELLQEWERGKPSQVGCRFHIHSVRSSIAHGTKDCHFVTVTVLFQDCMCRCTPAEHLHQRSTYTSIALTPA